MRYVCRTLCSIPLRSMSYLIFTILLLALVSGCSGMRQENTVTRSDQAGKTPWLVRGRSLAVIPDESSEITPIGGDADVSTEVAPEVDVSYFLTEHLAFEAVGGITRHAVDARNTSIGDLDAGEVSIAATAVTMQYHFRQKQRIRPYLGTGASYTFFFNEDTPQSGGGAGITEVDYNDSPGGVLQAGMDIDMGPPGWALNVDVKKMFLQTDARISSTAGSVDADVDLDPWLIGIGFAYDF